MDWPDDRLDMVCVCIHIPVWGRRRRHSRTHRCTWAKPLPHTLLHTQGGYSEEEGEGTRLMTPILEPAQVQTYVYVSWL